MPGEPLDFESRVKMMAEAAARARDPAVGAQLGELSGAYAAIARSGREAGLVWRFGNSPLLMAGSERISESLATLETFEFSVLFGFEVRSVPDPVIGRTSNPAH